MTERTTLLQEVGQAFRDNGLTAAITALIGGFIALLAAVAYSGVIRPPIPKVSGHPFRFYPAIDSGASGHPVM